MYLYHGIHNYTQDFSLYMKYGNKERLMNDTISPEKVKQSNYSAVHLEYSNMWWTDMKYVHRRQLGCLCVKYDEFPVIRTHISKVEHLAPSVIRRITDFLECHGILT